MRRWSWWRRAWPWFVSVPSAVALCVLAAGPAEGGGTGDDGVPRGAVAFFTAGTACPMGWSPADAVAGRMVVGVTDPARVGHTVGTPLGDREDRTHTHPVRAGLTLTPRNIAGADGPNRQGAASGAQTVTGTTAAGASGLPFVQLRACVKR